MDFPGGVQKTSATVGSEMTLWSLTVPHTSIPLIRPRRKCHAQAYIIPQSSTDYHKYFFSLEQSQTGMVSLTA